MLLFFTFSTQHLYFFGFVLKTRTLWNVVSTVAYKTPGVAQCVLAIFVVLNPKPGYLPRSCPWLRLAGGGSWALSAGKVLSRGFGINQDSTVPSRAPETMWWVQRCHRELAMKSLFFLTAELHPDQYTSALWENVTGRWMDFILVACLHHSPVGFCFFYSLQLILHLVGEDANHWWSWSEWIQNKLSTLQ